MEAITQGKPLKCKEGNTTRLGVSQSERRSCFLFLNVLPMLCDFQGLSSWTRDTTQATGHESTKLYLRDRQECLHVIVNLGKQKSPQLSGPQFAKAEKEKGQNQDPTPSTSQTPLP